MKKGFIICFMLLWATFNLKSQSLQVSFTTVPITSGISGEFSPRHVLAVWVETSDGAFVSSLMVMAKERIGYLTNWNAKTLGNKVNAITGSTLTTHTNHTIIWNCKKYNGDAIADGDYKLCIELTSGDATGTISKNPFSIASGTLTYSQSGSNITGFSLLYSATTTSVENSSIPDVLKAYPNPVSDKSILKFFTVNSSDYNLEIVNQEGKIVQLLNGQSVQGDNFVTLDFSSLPAGIYYCVLKTKDYFTSLKMLKK